MVTKNAVFMRLVAFRKRLYRYEFIWRCGMDYMTLKEAGEKWNISARMINYYCAAGRIPGAEKKGTVWLIPISAKKPIDRRRKKEINIQ